MRCSMSLAHGRRCRPPPVTALATPSARCPFGPPGSPTRPRRCPARTCTPTTLTARHAVCSITCVAKPGPGPTCRWSASTPIPRLRSRIGPDHGERLVNRLQRLREAGVSIWLDALSRELLETDEFARLVGDCAATGATSNPTIFAKAIAASDRYDQHLRARAACRRCQGPAGTVSMSRQMSRPEYSRDRRSRQSRRPLYDEDRHASDPGQIGRHPAKPWPPADDAVHLFPVCSPSAVGPIRSEHTKGPQYGPFV